MSDSALRRWWLPIALSALFVSLVIVGFTSRDRGDVPGRGAMAVARTEAINFFSLDHREPEKSVDRVLALATGKFRSEYQSQRGTIVKSIVARELVVEASVPDDGIGLERLEEDRAQALVAVDTVSRSKTGTEEKQFRTRLSLVRVNGAWKVEALEQVG